MTTPAEEKETGRIEAFSDGVFAIAITLLILEIKVPHLPDGGAGRSLARALVAEWPSYLAFVLSFSTILIMWANHHAMFRLVHKVDVPFLYANGFLLLLVTFVPYPTAVLAEYLELPGAPIAGAFYAGTYVVIGIAFNVLWAAASRGRRLLKPGVSEETVRAFSRSYRLGPPLYLAATAAAFVNVFVTVAICVALATFWIVTGRSH
ncbi:MAG: TMEM175 family protein [Thermoanaerobaculia bacterium]